VIPRCVRPELLDELPPAHPCAVRSRQDLLRVNAWMGNRRIMAHALRPTFRSPGARRIVDLGAGDGRFLLCVAWRLPSGGQGTTAVLLDRQSIVSPETRKGFERRGWRLELVPADVFDWLSQPAVGECDAVVANLFLHHFPEPRLARLMSEAARRAKVFIAIEPRRSAWSSAFSRLLWMLGCGPVTRHDARVSVRAGFAGCELSRLWPAYEGWSLRERSVGWFSHLFTARRIE
jgi:SAM-dependent methyltransferase